MYDILDCLDRLEKTSSRKDKEAILRQFDSPNLREFLYLTYNKFITYRLQQIDKPTKYAQYQGDIFLELKETCRTLASHTLGSNAAKALVQQLLSKCTEANAKWIERCITRDLLVGIDEKTINKVFPGLIPVFSCQLANKVEDLNSLSYPAICEVKLDGLRCLCIVKDGIARFYSREGREFDNPNLKVIADQAIAISKGMDIVLDGEFIAKKYNPSSKTCKKYEKGNWPFNYALSLVKNCEISSEEISGFLGYYVWDVLHYDYFQSQGTEGETVPLSRRKNMLSTLFGEDKYPNVFMLGNWVCKNPTEVMQLFRKLRDDGHEGLMWKSINSKYDFKRSDAVLKLKEMYDADLVIVGAEEGTGRNAGKLGALLVESSDGIVKSKVGSGVTDDDRDSLWFDFNEGHLVGKICVVTYQERTKDNSLRFPVFQGIRWDKTVADSSEVIK